MNDIERQDKILKLLQQLKGLDPLKQLFWSELGYDRVNETLSRRDWSQSASGILVEDPILFANAGQDGSFHIIYNRLPQNKIILTQERPIVNQLIKQHEYGLYIFSNQTQDQWHFINSKYEQDSNKRRLFRRISISPKERLRTASERIAMLDLQTIPK
jgi:hypothetical protein